MKQDPQLSEEPKRRRTKTPDEALAALMRLCARAEKTESDARRLLDGWGVAEAEARRIVERLVRERFIDDARYAAAFVREKLRLSGWGAYKIRAALRRKGIDPGLIDEALAQADEEGMRGRLHEMLARKARTVKHASGRELKTKLIRYGLSLGYEYDAVLDEAAAITRQQYPCDEY